MSFLKFLKSTKKKPKFDFPKADLDSPPAPPEVPRFPASESIDMPPEMPQDIGMKMDDVPMPEIPSGMEMPDMNEPIVAEPTADELIEEPTEPFTMANTEFEEAPTYEEPRKLNVDEPIFVEVQHYKALMDEISTVKNRLKESADVLQKVADLKESQEADFEKWHNTLQDIQRKLIFVDKTLFRG